MRSRKILALALFAATLLVVLIPVAILESRRTPDWQTALEQYFEISGDFAPGNRLVEVAEARYPEQFVFQIVSPVPVGSAMGGTGVPLPEKVRCIQIEEAQAEPGRQPVSRYLLVGYHDDRLWHVGWLVHEFCENVSVEEQQALLAKLGCDDWVETSILIHSTPTPEASRTPIASP